MKKEPRGINPEQYLTEAIERKYGHPETAQEALTGAETGGKTIFLFEVGDSTKTEVYAWLGAREAHPWLPKVFMTPKSSTVNSFAEACRSLEEGGCEFP